LPTTSDASLKAEERRALVLLGLLAVIVGLYDKLPADSFVNFPLNSPFPHLTILVSPLLLDLIGLWVAYGISMFFYFSDDWFPESKTWSEFRMVCHGAGLLSIGLLLVIGYITVFAEISFLLPSSVQDPYWILATAGEFVLVLYLFEASFRQRGIIRRGARVWISSIAELGRELKSGIVDALEARKKRKKKKGQQPKKASG